MDTIFNTEGCFYRALDDEPIFVLLARDPCFAETVRWWVTLRQALIGQGKKPLEDHEALSDALKTASAGHIWRQEATDPALFPDGQGRWHKEPVPARELVETDRIAKLETRLLQDAEMFLHYAQNHFGKGTADSERKGEVNWSAYMEICEVLSITPAEKPVASGEPKSDRDRLSYDDWLDWKQKAMPIGNDFLLGLHKGKLWFSQRNKHAAGESWSDLFMLQKSLQSDMIRGMYNDYRTRQVDRADRLSAMLPDYKGLMAKIACGLRQVTGDILEWIGDRENDRANALKSQVDRINGYAAELETGYHGGGMIHRKGHDPVPRMVVDAATPEEVLESFRERFPGPFAKWLESQKDRAEKGTVTVNVEMSGVTDREQAERLRRHISDPSVKITPKPVPFIIEYFDPAKVEIVRRPLADWPAEALKLLGRQKAESDTLDVTDTPDMPPHRFTMFTKAKGWAYGRGLEINPGHIPDMLDRMDADGWHLQCVFGGVQADKVGMLFRRMDIVRGEDEVYVRDLPPSVAEMMSAPTEGEDYDDIGMGRGQEP